MRTLSPFLPQQSLIESPQPDSGESHRALTALCAASWLWSQLSFKLCWCLNSLKVSSSGARSKCAFFIIVPQHWPKCLTHGRTQNFLEFCPPWSIIGTAEEGEGQHAGKCTYWERLPRSMKSNLVAPGGWKSKWYTDGARTEGPGTIRDILGKRGNRWNLEWYRLMGVLWSKNGFQRNVRHSISAGCSIPNCIHTHIPSCTGLESSSQKTKFWL